MNGACWSVDSQILVIARLVKSTVSAPQQDDPILLKNDKGSRGPSVGLNLRDVPTLLDARPSFAKTTLLCSCVTSAYERVCSPLNCVLALDNLYECALFHLSS